MRGGCSKLRFICFTHAHIRICHRVNVARVSKKTSIVFSIKTCQYSVYQSNRSSDASRHLKINLNSVLSD